MNESGLKSLDKIGESPKIERVIKDHEDIVIFLKPGYASVADGGSVLRAKDIKNIWHLFRHGITQVAQFRIAEPAPSAAPTPEVKAEPSLVRALKHINGVDFTGLKGDPKDFVIGAPIPNCTSLDHIFPEPREVHVTRCLCGRHVWGEVLKR